MNEREYIEEIEGLMVKITYEYEEGDNGDYYTPPTPPHVTIIGWELCDECRDDYPEYDDDEWEEWMKDINTYVCNESVWDIIEFEEDLETIL